MAKFDYESVTATAKSLIDEFGREITLKVVTNSGTEWNPTQSEVVSTITAVFTNFSKNEIDNVLILATDKKLLSYEEISLTDFILDDGIDYKVMNVDTIQTGDIKIIFKAQLRR